MSAAAKLAVGIALAIGFGIAMLTGSCATAPCPTATQVMEWKGYVVVTCEAFRRDGDDQSRCLILPQNDLRLQWHTVTRRHCGL